MAVACNLPKWEAIHMDTVHVYLGTHVRRIENCGT